MKTPKVVYVGILLSFLLSGCMPDSFTKFKEEPAKKKQEATAPPVEPPTLADGSDIDFDKFITPTQLGYSSTPTNIDSQIFVFQVGRPTTDAYFNGPCGIRPKVDETFDTFFCEGPFAEDSPEAAELREVAEVLKFKYTLVNPNLTSGTPACDGATENLALLPNGMYLDSSQGFLAGVPTQITSDTNAGANFGLPYPVGVKLEFLTKYPDGLVRYKYLCTTIKVAAYEIPTSRDFNYQQSTTVKLELDPQTFVGQGSMAAFSIGDPISSLDKDGNAAGSGTVIFVDTQGNKIIVSVTSGDFYVGGTIDDSATYFGPEATIKKLTNVFQTSTTNNINVGPLGLPPAVAVPGPYSNRTLGPENGVRFLTDFTARPSTLTFNNSNGLFNGRIETEIKEAPLSVAAINPLWQDSGFEFFKDVVNPATGAYIGNVRFTDLPTKYLSVGEAATQAAAGSDLAIVTENFEVTDPALDGGYSDQYLLEVNDASNFNVGDFVSTNSCGTGSNDSHEMTVGRVLAKVQHVIPKLSYILVQYMRGCAFKNFESIDNAFPYKSPKATVYRAIPNSMVIQTTNNVSTWGSYLAGSTNYHISAPNGAKGIINMIQNGNSGVTSDGVESGFINPAPASNVYYIFVRVTSPVDVNNDSSVVDEMENYFSTVTTYNATLKDYDKANCIENSQVFTQVVAGVPQNCAAVAGPVNIQHIYASTLNLNLNGVANGGDIETGDTFSSALSSGMQAFGDIINADDPDWVVAVLNKGFLRAGVAIDDENPYPGVPTPVLPASITYVPSFYLKKGNFYEFPFTLDQGTVNSSTSLDPVTAPPGMVFETNGTLKGQLSENMTKTAFTVSASNGAGKTSFKSNFEVLEYFELTARTTNDNRNTSVVLHRAGQGNQLAPCGMFEAQMGVVNGSCSVTCAGGSTCRNKEDCLARNGNWTGKNNDILCYLEIGEEDLFYNGLNLKLEVSGAQCEFVAHKPYTFYQWQPGDTPTPDVFVHTVPNSCNDSLIGTGGASYQPKPVENISTNINGSFGSGLPSPRARCLYENGGFDYADIYTTLGLTNGRVGPNCDEGDVQVQNVEWTLDGFKCFNSAGGGGGVNLAYGTADDCYKNIGTCTPGGASAGCAVGGPPGTCADQAECEDDDGTWTFTGSHNDSSKVGYTSAVPEKNDCFRAAPAAGDLVPCAGNHGACMATSFKGIGANVVRISPNTRKELGGIINNMIVDSNATSINYTYFAPDDDTNLLADYPRNDPEQGNTAIIANYYGADATCAGAVGGYVYSTAGQIKSAEAGANHMLRAGLGTNPFYTYECRNSAGDSKGIIRLLVRDWNEDFQNQTGFQILDMARPTSLIDGGLDNYTDLDAAATTATNKCNGALGAGVPAAPAVGDILFPTDAITPAFPAGGDFPRNKL